MVKRRIKYKFKFKVAISEDKKILKLSNRFVKNVKKGVFFDEF